MRRLSRLPFIAFAAGLAAAVHGGEPAQPARPLTVASYYFGNYHQGDPRNVKNKGEGWSEWELVKAAKPRFPGHQQPKVPLWGYSDESDPAVMARKIAAAADHGIDAFIFDWYYYDDGPFPRPADRPGVPPGEEQPAPQVRPDVGQPRLAGNPSLQARHPAEATVSGQGDARDLRETLQPRHQRLLPASLVLAHRGPALLLVLRAQQAPGELRQRSGHPGGLGSVSGPGPGCRAAGSASQRGGLGPADPAGREDAGGRREAGA